LTTRIEAVVWPPFTKLTPMDYAMGKDVVVAQLPVPHESTVALLKRLGALEGKDVK